MHQIMDVSGAVLHSEREYDIASTTAITVGQVVKMTSGLVVAALAAETGAILGVAAESHPGTADALNPRSNGTKIIVHDAPGAIFECPAIELNPSSAGNATTVKFTAASGIGSNVFDGGYIKDSTGSVRRITSSTESSGTVTLTVESGYDIPTTETFLLFPPVGFGKGNFSSDGTKLVVSATAALPVQVVGRDEANGKIWIAATKHMLAVAR